ncbi:LacI family DNA-binding transcriptional regulator [Formosa sp. S-31]|uniref:LacI family DNA-binding transcriptional regulator n=1 Tax=Formosa sp. S-31 TaxID=2790949 RepID=UPI003EB8202D
MNFKKEITIYDIAKETNYSPSTVSRALNNNSNISEKTIKKIQEAARKMGYSPNTMAANLRNSKSNTIGILISRINRPFVSNLISGIEETARNAGYNVIISQSYDEYEIEVNNSEALYNSRIAGLISSLAMETQNYEHFKKFIDQGIPVVFVDRVPDLFNVYKVIIDNYSAGYNATKHLIEQGCTRIAHFAGLQHRMVFQHRKQGYLNALKEHNIAVDENLIIHFKSLSLEEGKKATKTLLKSETPPDGIFSANDTAAVGAIMSAKKLGVKIPDDLCIIGFNNDPIATIVDPPLSTIKHPARKMGELSALRVLNHTHDNTITKVSEISMLKTEVLVRASSSRKKEKPS